MLRWTRRIRHLERWRIRRLRCRLLHCVRVDIEKSYRVALDLVSEMPHILREIGCLESDLPDYSTLVKRFDKLTMAVWRVLLGLILSA